MSQTIAETQRLELLDWITTAGLEGHSPEQLLNGFCEKAVECGIPVDRVQISGGLVDPTRRGFALTWKRDIGKESENAFIHDSAVNPAWYRSPGQWQLSRLQQTLISRLDARETEDPWFPLYDDLAAEGYVEYLSEIFSYGWESTADHDSHIEQVGVLTSWATRQNEGFGDAMVPLRQVIPVFALALKSQFLAEMAENLMVIYTGEDAGKRIVHGDIHRGDTRELKAAIMLADLRGFTSLSDRAAAGDMVGLLNRYFELICASVHQNGGQVLKFLGDGLLAVFDDARGEKPESALIAAERALGEVAALNESLSAEGKPSMPLDIALHYGEVAYGNIGAPDRLDFTVIGPAVNEAARMEGACGELNCALLISDDFARALDDPSRLVDLGQHSFRGLSRPRTLYGLNDDV